MSSRLRYAIFCALCLMPLVIGRNALAATLSLALREDAYTHILLILPISITLAVLEWRRLECKPKPSPLAGLALLCLAAVIGVVGLEVARADVFTDGVRLSIAILAIVIWWIGSFIGCFGYRTGRRCLFPLLFLLFLVPIPRRGVDFIVEALQLGTATFARVLFTVCGVPVLQDRTVLAIPGLTLEVAQECSSIRSSLMLIVTATVLSHLLLRSAWSKAIVIFAALPLSIAKNGLRVFTLAMLGKYVDPAFLNGSLHRQGGPLFFAAALVAIFGLIWFLCEIERKRRQPPLAEHLCPVESRGMAN